MTSMPQAHNDLNPIVASSRVVVCGVDTHKELHVAAVVDTGGCLLGTHSFSTTRAGYRALTRWVRSFGDVRRVGVEGTGSYGAGITRTCPAQASTCSRSTGRTAPTAAARARTTTSTRSTPPAPRCTTSAPVPRSARTGRWNRCECCG